MRNHKNIILPHTFHDRVSYVSRSRLVCVTIVSRMYHDCVSYVSRSCLCKNAERNPLNSYNNKSQKKKKIK